MLVETFIALIQEIQKDKDKMYSTYLLFMIKNFIDEYISHLASIETTPAVLIEIGVVSAIHGIIIEVCRDQLKEYYTNVAETEFRQFQEYVNDDLIMDTVGRGKTTSLYSEYCKFVINHKTVMMSVVARISIWVASIFKMNDLCNRAKFEFKDRFLLMINVITSLGYTLMKLEEIKISPNVLEDFENTVSVRISEFFENNRIINETDETETFFDEMIDLTSNVARKQVEEDITVPSSLNRKFNQSVHFQIMFTSIVSLFMKQDSSINLYMSVEYPNILKDLRYYLLSYYQCVSTYAIYKQKFKEHIKRQTIPITSDVVFEAHNAKIAFDNTILSEINYSFSIGEWISLYGESGSGKTSLCNFMSGQLSSQNDQNKTFCGKRYNYFDIADNISCIVLQGDIFSKSIKYNCLFGSEESEENICKMYRYLDMFGIGDLNIEQNAKLCSSGQKQRIKIIRMIILNRPIWILDEITSNIDDTTAVIIMTELRKISKDRKLVISISHNRSLIDPQDKLYEIHHGRLVKMN